MSTDEIAAAVKHSEHTVKVKHSFGLLKEKHVTKSTQLPKSLSKTMIFFTETSLRAIEVELALARALRAENTQVTLSHLRHELDELGIDAGL